MTPIQRKRLIRYANFLNRLPSKHFDLNVICRADKNPIAELKDIENSCGTTACAYGHLPVFNPRVFAFCRNKYGTRWGNLNVVKKGENESLNFKPATEYFGITLDQAIKLFSPNHYPRLDWNNPKAVAERIYTKILKVKVPA